MSFAAPLVLLGLIALPALAAGYIVEQRRRARGARAFVSEPLLASVAPRRPGPRRHLPYLLLGFGLALLILALAKPQHSVRKPVSHATVVLANDVSDSMTATDVRPSRLVAAMRAATGFMDQVPSSFDVGSIEFARRPELLQTATTDHALVRAAISQLKPGGEGTAIGGALALALSDISAVPKLHGKRPPGAVILISDGASNAGVSPLLVAAQARKQRVPIYTISIGTAHGQIQLLKHGQKVTSPVPVDPTELSQIATASGGHAYRAPDSATVHAIYAHLATALSHKLVQESLIAEFLAAALLLLALAIGGSLFWFARLA